MVDTRQFRRCWKKKETTSNPSIEKKNDRVSFLQLFRWASRTDKILMAIAATAALFNGVCLPISVVLFGDFANIIVYAAGPEKNVTNSVNTTQCQSPSSSDPIVTLIPTNGNGTDIVKEGAVIYAIGTIVLGLFSVLMNFIFITCFNVSAENQIYRLRSAVVKSILAQEISWHDTRTTDGLAIRITEDLTKIHDGIGEKVGLFLSYSSIAFCGLVVAFYYGWELALITLVAMPILTITAGILAKIQSSLTARETEAYATAGGLAEEIIGAIKTVTMFGAQEKEVERFETSLKPARKAGIKRGLATAIGNGLVWILTYASYALSFWYGIKIVLETTCEDGTTSKYDAGILNIVFFNMLYAALKLAQLLPFFEAFASARSAVVGVNEILDKVPEINSLSSAGICLENINGHIEIENVDFSYSSRPDVPILRGISFKVAAGSTVALVGQSGCGKSTCIQLLQRFYDPVQGRIKVDGHDIKELNVRWWRENIGVVGQEPVLFSLSIRDNILYGHPRDDGISQHDVELAAKQANAHDFITSLPRGYNTLVGERGAHLSGGQKQRIAIARALIRNPKILLFDEATSALDTRSEAVVQKALDQARQGRTTVIVAHRLTTIRNADSIFVFNRGVIEEVGTHDNLMAKRGLYYKLVESQQQSFTTDKSHQDDGIQCDDQSSTGSSYQRRKSFGSDNQAREKHNVSSKTSSLNEFTKEDEEVSLWQIMRMNQPEWIYITLGVIGSAILGLSTPVYAMLFGEVMGLLDQSLDEDVQKLNNTFALIFLGIAFGTGIGAFMQTFTLTIAGERLTFRLRTLTFRSILWQKIGWFDRLENSVGSLCVRLSNDASAIQGATGARIGLLVQVSVSIFFALALSLFFEWKLALASGVFVPIVLFSGVLEVKLGMGQNLIKMKALDQSSRIGTEAISNIRTVASLGREETFHNNYMSSLREPYTNARKQSPIRAVIFGLTSNMSSFASVVCMCYGSYLIQNEGLAYKEVFKICEALVFGMEMVGQTLAFTPNYSRAKNAAKRIFQLIKSNSTPDPVVTTENKLELEGKVEFDNVHFCYPTRANVPVLRGLSTTIRPGQTVALVGHSGCGKSTLIQLLQRFYEPDYGTVLVDDEDISSISASLIRTNIGIVSQEPVLFNRTIAENIAYGDQTRTISIEEIIEAARKANVHSFIQNLPLGYETPVGQRGTQLSGGQKQRIAIARALIRHPRILLLDEATSALDTESERIVQEALDRASHGRTCIIIAHRLSTVQNADCILVVDHGQIKEQGKHEDLVRLKGIYYQLWTIQGLPTHDAAI